MTRAPRSASYSGRSAGAVGPVVMAVVLCLATGYMIIDALGFPFRVKVGPLTFSGATFVLSVIVLVREIAKYRKRRTPAASDAGQVPADGAEAPAHEAAAAEPDGRVTPSEIVAFGWVAAIVAAFFLLGFMVGMPLFMLALMRMYGRETWRLSIAVTASVMVAVYVLFVRVLSVPVYPGILSRYLPFG